jgi:competence protein ComEC
MLLIYPPNAFSAGFWLSVFAVLGITLFSNLLTAWIVTAFGIERNQKSADKNEAGYGCKATDKATAASRRKRLRERRKHLEPIASSLAMTLAATGATMPLAVPLFSMFSLISPLANLVLAPLVALMLAVGMLALCITPLVPALAQLALVGISLVGDLVAWLASVGAAVPYAALPVELAMPEAVVGSLILAAAAYVVWPRPRRVVARALPPLLLALALTLGFITPFFTPPQMVVMDVGQGDAILVREGSSNVLIDTGPSEQALLHALARNRVTRLDAVIITHLDFDHYGALLRLRGTVQVDRIYFAQGLLANQQNDKAVALAKEVVGENNVLELRKNDCLTLGLTTALSMVWPVDEAQEGSNAESICLLLRYDYDADGKPEWQTLLTGDAETNEIAGILRAYPQLTADIYKVGHHGSKVGITLGQLQALRSTVALISVGAHNNYGHPSTKILGILEEAGCSIYRTDLNGDITVKFHDTSLDIYCATMGDDLY